MAEKRSVDCGGGVDNAAFSASKWLKQTLASVGITSGYVGGAVNRELSADIYYFATFTLEAVGGGSGLIDGRSGTASLANKIEEEAKRIFRDKLDDHD